jgi:hypothetical protein
MEENSRPQTGQSMRPPTSQSTTSSMGEAAPPATPTVGPMSARPVSRRRFGDPMTARQVI